MLDYDGFQYVLPPQREHDDHLLFQGRKLINLKHDFIPSHLVLSPLIISCASP